MSDDNPLAIDWTEYVQARRDGTPIPEKVLKYIDGLAARLQTLRLQFLRQDKDKITRLDRVAIHLLGIPSARGQRTPIREKLGESNRGAGFVFAELSSGKTLNRSYAVAAKRLDLSKSTVQKAWVKNGREWHMLSRFTITATNPRTGITITKPCELVDIDVADLIATNNKAATARRVKH